jgi:hypothetical protein
LCEVAADAFAWSPRLRPIEYPPSLVKLSRTVVSHDLRAPSSSINEEE